MSDYLARLYAVERQRLTVFVGSGVSALATGGAECATWWGLLDDGIERCARMVPMIGDRWADVARSRLEDGDMITRVSVADEVARRLRGISDGREFTAWINGTVGALVACDEDLLHAIGNLNKLVVTTNYDKLIEKTCERPTVTWTDDPEYVEALSGQSAAVVHLHGVVGKPDSIFLGPADYRQMPNMSQQHALLQGLFIHRTLVIVGCGDGLRDRSIGPVLSFLDSGLPPNSVEHYQLVLGSELGKAMAHPLGHSIVPVAYGETEDDLLPFLQGLAAGSRDLMPSQDAAYYALEVDQRPRIALLDLAGPAERGLHEAHETLQRALRAIGRVERVATLPGGMRRWDLSDQQEVHEQHAAAVIDPSDDLATCAALFERALQDAEPLARQLLARKFTEQIGRLAPLTRLISTISNLRWPRYKAPDHSRGLWRAGAGVKRLPTSSGHAR